MNILSLLLIILGISVQHIAKKTYSKLSAGVFSFSAISALTAATIFIVTANGELNFNTGIIIYSVLFAATFSLGTVCSFMAIRTGPLSLTSLITQCSLVIPAIYGLIFLNEPIKMTMISGIILLLISIFLLNMKGKDENTNISFKWAVFAFLSFLGNGVCSVVQKVQQIESGGLYKSELMIIAYAITAVLLICFAWFTEKGYIVQNIKKGFLYSLVCGLANGIVNFFVLMLATRMAASIMFPVVSAGGIVTTSLIAITVYREKLSLNQKFALMLGIAAILVLNF
jgi:drug/metabolite transporter (DMT)-like permease